jgi:site-specific DNA-methyltransferase (adenine-specific)
MPREPNEDAPKDKRDNYNKAREKVQAKRDRLMKKYADLETIPCVVMDPFAGSGTSGLVAIRNDRSFIGIDLSEEYLKLAKKRIKKVAGQPTLFRPEVSIEMIR